MNIEITRYASSPHTNDKVPDWEEFKISQSLYRQCLDGILWEFTYLCCFRPQVSHSITSRSRDQGRGCTPGHARCPSVRVIASCGSADVWVAALGKNSAVRLCIPT